jgi:hypothetical protein
MSSVRPRPTNIYAAAMRHRAELLRMEGAASTEMVRSYALVWRDLQGKLTALFAKMKAAEAAGETITQSWLYQQGRLEDLLAQTEAEMIRFSRGAEAGIIDAESQAIRLSQQHLGEYVALAPHKAGVVSSFARMPTEAMTDLVGFMRNGSPLRTLLDALGPDASQAVRDGLVRGIGSGLGPRAIARTIREGLGGNLTRALTISRTEVLRAYRESERRGYAENPDVIRGWVWACSRNLRVCPSCWAMDGTRHRVEEQMSDHPNGACVAAPDIIGVDVLAGRKWGKEAFDELSEDQQRAALGKAGYAAYKDGAVTLKDFVGVHLSKEWGTTRSARGLSRIPSLSAEDVKKYRAIGAAKMPAETPNAWGAPIKFISKEQESWGPPPRGYRRATDKEKELFISHLSKLPDDMKGMWRGDASPIMFLMDDESGVAQHLAACQGNHIYLAKETIDFPGFAQHEFIHYQMNQGYIGSRLLNEYHPPDLFQHAREAGHQLDENLTMLLSSYDRDKSKWIRSIVNIESGIDEAKSSAQVEAALEFLKRVGVL